MSVAGSQQQTFLRLLTTLRPQWRRDVTLPDRIQTLLARNKDFGSRDRRLYRELIYTTLRYLAWIEPLLDSDAPRAAKIVAWLAAETRDTSAYRAELCGDWAPLPTLAERAAFLGLDATALLPAWFRAECPAAFESPELDRQLMRAPLWLRLQTDAPAAVESEFAQNAWRWEPAAVLAGAWRLLDEVDVTPSAAYTGGAIEVQDLGSQFVLSAIGVPAGGHWLDACAGAGGKTLQLSRLLGPAGRVDAFDTRPEALTELATRAGRIAAPTEAEAGTYLVGQKGFAPIHVLHSPPGASPVRRRPKPATPETSAIEAYDGVLVDAPCSGTGTWRRSPHLKWTSSPKLVADRAGLQQVLLERYSRCVRPGGTLVYATCSLAHRENEAVVATFLASHPEFEPQPLAHTFGFTATERGLTIFPSRHDTDGFFVASLRRR